MCCNERPELSVIVPVFNEGGIVPPFLHHLSLQRQVRIELILSDGGSDDRTLPQARRLAAQLPFPLHIVEGPKGRGAQLNRGAAAARGEQLLFLHADSTFPDPLSLRRGLDTLATGGAEAACHFSLEFRFDGPAPSPYRFYAAKATLGRPGCSHGDQGLLLSAAYFARLGGFREGLAVLEDTLLADRVAATGKLLLIPARIATSPRRFLAEGLLPRQTLNAILMDLAHVDRFDLIDALGPCYRSQDRDEPLRLRPFLELLRREIVLLPPRERRRLWRDTGRYVRGNAWQIPFCFDFLRGDWRPGRGGRLLALHDRVVGPLLENRVADLAAAALVRLWFGVALLLAR